MIILGLSAFYHDSAAAIIINGKIIAAAQEERFTRIKHDPSFPLQSINYVLNEAKITIGEVNNIGDDGTSYVLETWVVPPDEFRQMTGQDFGRPDP